MSVERELPAQEASDLLSLVATIADRELAPEVDAAEEGERFPREVFTLLGRAGLLSLPFDEAIGGGGQTYEVYLQVLEELAMRWAAVAVGVSVHTLSCHAVSSYGTAAQRDSLLPAMLGGETLGAYCLSEAHAGSDPSAMRASAKQAADGSWLASGTKAWITHGGHADFYTTFLRTSPSQVSCFHIQADDAELAFGAAERKMGLRSSATTTVILDGVQLPAERLIGERGQGLPIAFSALDSGRLGIAAVATGIAQASLDLAVRYAAEREAFGHPVIEHQGLAFLLADMAAQVESARATYLVAARRRDRGQDFSRAASVAKLVTTDVAMAVTTDAVQVLGGAGYTRDFAAERYMREAKVTQIFEGTNQIQRLVISRHLARNLRKGQL